MSSIRSFHGFSPEVSPTAYIDPAAHVIGHGAVLHGCTVQDASLIGMRATIMDGSLVKRHALVGAGAVVPQGRIVGEGELWVGNPARCVRLLSSDEIQQIYYVARQYVKLKAQYLAPTRTPAPPLAGFDRRLAVSA